MSNVGAEWLQTCTKTIPIRFGAVQSSIESATSLVLWGDSSSQDQTKVRRDRQFVMPVIFAQALGEYGAASALATALESLAYRLEAIVQGDRPSLLVIVSVAALAWWLFFRQK